MRSFQLSSVLYLAILLTRVAPSVYSDSVYKVNSYLNSKYSGPKIVIEKFYEQSHFSRLGAAYVCESLFQESRDRQVWPPPRFPPEETVDLFTMGGSIPLTSFYFSQKYADGKALVGTWSKEMIESYIKATKQLANSIYKAKNVGVRVKNRKVNRRISRYGYRSTRDVLETMHVWKKAIMNKHVLVIGSERPWLEGMLLAFGAKLVTTLEYGSIIAEHPQLNSITVTQLNHAVRENATKYLGSFDTAFSYSSIEHAGLGRYGDSINPFGDLEEVARISCLLRKNGIFFLGFGIGKDKIEWNAHRIYGKKRLPLVTANYVLRDIIGEFHWNKADWKVQPILVLENQFSYGE